MIFDGLTFQLGFPTRYIARNQQDLPSSRYISSYMPQLENPAESPQPCLFGCFILISSTLQPSSLGTVIYVEAIPTLRCADTLRPIRFSVYASPVLFMRWSVNRSSSNWKAIALPTLRHKRNTQYGWVANPYPAGTFTLQDAPSFAWRANASIKGAR